MKGIREFLNTGPGKAISGVVIVVALAALAWSLKSQLGPGEAALSSRQRVFICTETGKSFPHELVEGEAVPIYSPHSGKNTGVLAESCYWTKDGKIKQDPTYVLLNLAVNKKGPTFCPDCGRLVVAHNPRPAEGAKPPPLQSEYSAKDNNFDR